MKYFVILFCFYFNVLSILPSVKVVKVLFFEKIEKKCTNSISDCNPIKECERENCLLNYSINSPVFLVFHSSYNFISSKIFIHKNENIAYHKNFISKYKATIWQPPESF